MTGLTRISLSVFGTAMVLVLGLSPFPGGQAVRVSQAAVPTDWAQVQKDPQRTGHSSEVLGTNFQVAWTHPFQPERVYPQVQAIISGGTVFVGTESGNLYALDATTGTQRWTFQAGGPILSSVAADNGVVYLASMDGAVYGLDASTGALQWKQQLSRRTGFSAAPVLAEGLVMFGGRDGTFYALSPDSGRTVWSYRAGAPILQTAAADGGRVFFGAMDMRVYALSTSTGAAAWVSDRLDGAAFKDYWPVVYQGKVLVRPAPRVPNPGIMPGFPFGWHDNSTWLSQYGATVAAGKLAQVPDAMNAQDAALAAYNANPGGYSKNLYVLDENTGTEAMSIPHWSSQTMNGASTPPTVDRDGMLVVPTLFVRSGWGRLDLTRQRIVDILYDGYTGGGRPYFAGQVPAGMGNQDENLNVSTSANLVLAFHVEESNANFTGAFDLGARRWTRIDAGWTNGQMFNQNQSGGGNPASVSNGMVYHISTHELIARSAQ